jgi:hypothetical protein
LWKTAALTSALWVAGCAPPSDRLLALPLPAPPTESDWDRASALTLRASGGVTSLPADAAVDGDSVHKVTASCHHGSGPPPVRVEMRAFYTPDRLYLRVRWGDPTRDLGPGWRWDGRSWKNGGLREDGLGILWGRAGDESFSCALVCHLRDFRMAGVRGFADFRMATKPKEALDFWIWRSGRARDGGFAEDALLTDQGRVGKAATELFAPNSLREWDKTAPPFSEGDTPRQAPDPEPGATAPGYLLTGSTAGRTQVDAVGRHERGVWEVTLSRPLKGVDATDATFAPGQETRFGLALLDGVAKDHNAVNTPVHLLLVAPQAFPKRAQGEP